MSVTEAYSATGGAWQAGPGRVYDRLAEHLVAACPGGVAGHRVLDLGAGTGAASRAAGAAGAASVVASDLAVGMLLHDARSRPPAVVGDACRLPFPAGAFGAVVAAFCLNHLVDPSAGLVEAARVLTTGGGMVASAYAADDTHPVKAVTEAACAAAGWVPARWYGELRRDAMPGLATVDRAEAAARSAGLHDAVVSSVRVPFPDLTPVDLVHWRLGMAQVAPFVATLTPTARDALVADALDRLGPSPPALVRSMIVITARAAEARSGAGGVA